MISSHHISVCICTYQRPEMLRRLLSKLEEQETLGLFTMSVVVVDNDSPESAGIVVNDFIANSSVQIRNGAEPVRNISLARNRAIGLSHGDYVALIDDDEYPESDWLLQLYRTARKYSADGVLGPVRPDFSETPPKWVVDGRFFEKTGPKTGVVLEWQQTRTSNVLLRRSVFEAMETWFRPELGRGGEDVDFFARAIARGHEFRWNENAAVYENIPAERCTLNYMMRRALLRGQMTRGYSLFNSSYILKSAIAIPGYLLLLPISMMAGRHHFVRILVKECEHVGRLLAVFGVDVVKEYYVSK